MDIKECTSKLNEMAEKLNILMYDLHLKVSELAFAKDKNKNMIGQAAEEVAQSADYLFAEFEEEAFRTIASFSRIIQEKIKRIRHDMMLLKTHMGSQSIPGPIERTVYGNEERQGLRLHHKSTQTDIPAQKERSLSLYAEIKHLRKQINVLEGNVFPLTEIEIVFNKLRFMLGLNDRLDPVQVLKAVCLHLIESQTSIKDLKCKNYSLTYRLDQSLSMLNNLDRDVKSHEGVQRILSFLRLCRSGIQ